MRFYLLLVLLLASCSGNGPAENQPTPATPQAQAQTSPGGGTGYGTTPHIRAYPATVTEGDSGETIVSVRITLSPKMMRQVTVEYMTVAASAKEADDFAYAKGQVTFKPGITEQAIEISIATDDIAEDEESFELRLAAPKYAQLDTESVTITIQDDD